MEPSGLLESFRRYLEKSKSPHTARLYYRSVKDFVEWAARRGYSLDRLTALAISDWQEELLGRLSPRSVDAMSAALKTFFRAMGRYDLAMAVPSVRYEARPIDWLEEPEVMRVIEAGETPLEQAVLATGYELALRVGEVPLLQRDWFSYELRQCRVQRLKRKGAVPTYDTLPMRPYFADKLRAYLETREDSAPPMFVAGKSLGSGRPRPISVGMVNYIYRKAARRVGGKARRLTWHAFARHSRITNYAIEMLRESGKVDLFRLMKLAGHVSEKSTLVYVHMATSWFYAHARGGEARGG